MTGLLDVWFPDTGRCPLCDDSLGARHRTIDTIGSRVLAGDPPEQVAADYNLPIAAVEACVETHQRTGAGTSVHR
jgi:hypothetical protein